MSAIFTWPVGRAGDDQSDVLAPPPGPVLTYLAGAICGGAGTATVVTLAVLALGAVGAGGSPLLPVAAVVLGITAIGLQLAGRVAPLPSRRRQVPRHWLMWRRRSMTALAFGLMIGAGGLTHLKHASAYVIVALVIVAPSPAAGIALGALYGGTRGMALVATWVGDRYVGRRPRWPESVPSSRRTNQLLAALSAVTLVLGMSLTLS